MSKPKIFSAARATFSAIGTKQEAWKKLTAAFVQAGKPGSPLIVLGRRDPNAINTGDAFTIPGAGSHTITHCIEPESFTVRSYDVETDSETQMRYRLEEIPPNSDTDDAQNKTNETVTQVTIERRVKGRVRLFNRKAAADYAGEELIEILSAVPRTWKVQIERADELRRDDF